MLSSSKTDFASSERRRALSLKKLGQLNFKFGLPDLQSVCHYIHKDFHVPIIGRVVV